MNSLVLSSADIASVLETLLDAQYENCAVLFTHEVERANNTRLLVSDVWLPDDADYARRGPFEAELSPHYVARIAQAAIANNLGVVFVHSHPGDTKPEFSVVDDDGETLLAAFFSRRGARRTNAALVVSRGGIAARVLGTNEPITLVELGPERFTLPTSIYKPGRSDRRYDRQIRALGEGSQAILSQLHLGIVGLGGIGSIVMEQLAHLGITSFTLVDPDVVEATNLNRLAAAGESDVGSAKVHVAQRYITKVNGGASVRALQEDVIRRGTARKLAEVDFIFGCTDSHGSRSVIQQIAYQYLIPCIDTGTTIVVNGSRVTHVQGRVQMLAPGLACLQCSKLLDPNEVRRDLMTAFERQTDPYIVGRHVPAPAVMSLNGTIASLAVTMFLAVVTGFPSAGRHLLYSALSSRLRSVSVLPDPKCFVCSRKGVLAAGDDQPLMARQD